MADKYLWKIGSPPPRLDKHSQVKHTIIQDYISRYIARLMAQANIPKLGLSIIDGFSGGGNYLTEEGALADGSPLLCLEAVQQSRIILNINRRQLREVDVEFTFVDVDRDTADYLKFLIDAKHQVGEIDEIDHQKTRVINSNFFSALPNILQNIKNRKMGERALFILDQYNYSDIPLPQIRHIFSSVKSAEVIMTFNVDSLITYLSDRAINRKPLETIGLDKYIPWDHLKHIKAEQKYQWRRTLQKHLAHGIQRETGAVHMTLFFVKPTGKNSWGYWLIHLSNNYRAHEVMKQLHWEHGTEFGHELESGYFILGYNANTDDNYTLQNSMSFGDAHSRESCINGINEHFGKVLFELDKPTKLGDLFESCITNSMASEVHLMAATQRLHQAKSVIIISKDGSVKRANKTYNLTDIIEPHKQIILL